MSHDHHYDKTPLEEAREELESDPAFIDLVDTNFHRNGLLYPADGLSKALAAYPSNRPYSPDPRGARPAREAIAAYYRHRGLEVDPDQIIITASASESYNLVFNRVVEEGRTVSLPKPVYPLFEFIAEFNHLEVEHYTLDLDAGAQPDPRRLASEVREGAGLLVAISPNNPTGTCLSRSSLDAIVGLARDRSVPLLFDEVFSEFVYPAASGDHRHTAPAERTEDIVCITLNGVSKMFASPDLKLSWLLVTGPEDLRDELLSVLEIANDMYLNASSVSQAILPTLFAEGSAFQREMVAELHRRRDLCLSLLAECPELEPVRPDGGIHCVLRVGRAAGARHSAWDDAELAERILRDTKVFTHPGYLYDIDDETALVISFLKEPPLLEEGLGRLTRWFAR